MSIVPVNDARLHDIEAAIPESSMVVKSGLLSTISLVGSA
jgi:hypothetical protein